MSDRIHVCCRRCQKTLAVPAYAEGKQARCPNCSELNLVVRPAAMRSAQPSVAPRKARPVESSRSSTALPSAASRSTSSASSSEGGRSNRGGSRPAEPSTSGRSSKPAKPVNSRPREEEQLEEDSRWEDAYDLAPADLGPQRSLPPRQVTAQPSEERDFRATSRAAAAGVPAHIIKEINDGGRFVRFHCAYSLIYITVWGYSDVHYLAPGKGTLLKSLPYTLMTMLFGWWGIPWGPIYTLKTIYVNMSGGLDETDTILHSVAYQTPSDPNSRSFY